MEFELTKEYLDHIEDAVEQRKDDQLRSELGDLHAVDINSILYELDTEDSKYIIELLDTETSAEILSDLDSDVRGKFLRHFEPAKLADFVVEMDSDDAADILNEQTQEVREEVIRQLPDDDFVEGLLDLLRYEEDTAGGLMQKELIKASIHWSVNQCIDEIRKQAENVEKVFSIYVVDERDRLMGRVSLKKMILTAGSTMLSDIYEEDLHSVDAFSHEDEVVRLMKKYDLEAIPVVNLQGRLVGRVTIDDVIDVLDEQAELERQLVAGLTENVESGDNVWMLTRARLPWLIIGMAGGLIAAQLIGFFEGDLKQIPAMAFFIPLIMATGGNVGIQSSTIIIQSLASDKSMEPRIASQLFKTLLVSILNGVAIASLVFGFNVLFVDWEMSMVVAVSLFGVVLLASSIGTLTPLILTRMKVNPALASGPFITTLNDLLGIAVYFTVAQMLLPLAD